jgi:hypothetical protein
VQQRLTTAEEDSKRKAALCQQLEGRLADISMGGEATSGDGGLSDIVRHWQTQVSAAEERARQAASEHAKEVSALRQAHARCVLRCTSRSSADAMRMEAAGAMCFYVSVHLAWVMQRDSGGER